MSAPVKPRKSASPTTRNAAKRRIEPCREQTAPAARCARSKGRASRPGESPKPCISTSPPAASRITLCIAAGQHRSRRPRSPHRSALGEARARAARTKITLAPCAATPRAMASAAASAPSRHDADTEFAHHHARDADSLQTRPHRRRAAFRRARRSGWSRAASAPAASTPSPAVAGCVHFGAGHRVWRKHRICLTAAAACPRRPTAGPHRAVPARTAPHPRSVRHVRPNRRSRRRRPQATPSPHRCPRRAHGPPHRPMQPRAAQPAAPDPRHAPARRRSRSGL